MLCSLCHTGGAKGKAMGRDRTDASWCLPEQENSPYTSKIRVLQPWEMQESEESCSDAPGTRWHFSKVGCLRFQVSGWFMFLGDKPGLSALCMNCTWARCPKLAAKTLCLAVRLSCPRVLGAFLNLLGLSCSFKNWRKNESWHQRSSSKASWNPN